MGLLDGNEEDIRENLSKHYYRFQSSEDIIQFFITLSRLKKRKSMEDIFFEGYHHHHDTVSGIHRCIETIYEMNPYRSRGYEFLISKVNHRRKGAGALKRWNMYLRWMVRRDNIDLGLWHRVDKKDLLLPLDTHTFTVGHKLGLLQRKQYDLEAVYEITEVLRSFDRNDPVKYDFAIYRLGQMKKV